MRFTCISWPNIIQCCKVLKITFKPVVITEIINFVGSVPMLNTMGHFTKYDLLLDTLFMTVAADTVALDEIFRGF